LTVLLILFIHSDDSVGSVSEWSCLSALQRRGKEWITFFGGMFHETIEGGAAPALEVVVSWRNPMEAAPANQPCRA
jgi:hypothetical protein